MYIVKYLQNYRKMAGGREWIYPTISTSNASQIKSSRSLFIHGKKFISSKLLKKKGNI